MSRVEDPRLREILLALVRHLHGFVREVRLSEREFGDAVRIIAALGQKTTASHNEVMLMAGSLGVSPLVCLLNNGNHGQTETQANMLGPFWRDDQPVCAKAAPRWCARRRRDRNCSFRFRLRIRPAIRSRVPRSTSGIPRRKVSTKTRIPRRPR